MASTIGMSTNCQLIDTIVSDITTIARIRNDISDDKRIRIHKRLIRLTNILRNNNHDIARTEEVIGFNIYYNNHMV